MKPIKFTAIAGVIAFATLLSQPANAIGLGGLSRDLGNSVGRIAEPTRAPLAYMMLCLKTPDHCQTGGEATASYGFDLAIAIHKVNDKINRLIKPQLDERDVWTVGANSGDCEDYALTKRRDLINAGVPAGALRMAVVLTEKGDGHAVLIVKTDVGDLVLDNRRKNIVTSDKTGYTFLKMATANPLNWLELKHHRYIKNSTPWYLT